MIIDHQTGAVIEPTELAQHDREILTLTERVEAALAHVETLTEALNLADQAATIRQYLKRRNAALEAQNHAATLHIKAEWAAGLKLREMPKNEGELRRGNIVLPRDAPPPTLAELGITKMQSTRMQELASLDEAELNQYIETTANAKQEITATGARRIAKEKKREQKRNENRDLVERTPPPALAEPGQRYQTLVIDPPWDWGDEGDQDQFGRARPTYHTMSIDDIAMLPIADLATKNAHIYCWITNRSLPKGFALLDAWGFRYVTMITWGKPSFGMGNYFRGQTEHVLFGVRGSLPLLRNDVGTLLLAPRAGRHSAKPTEFYELVETCSPGPWLELFARTVRPGWVSWGAEVNDATI